MSIAKDIDKGIFLEPVLIFIYNGTSCKSIASAFFCHSREYPEEHKRWNPLILRTSGNRLSPE
jgi:hypothetical protein